MQNFSKGCYFHIFPSNVTRMREIMGEEGRTDLHSLEVELKKCRWDAIDDTRACDAKHSITESVS